MIEEITYDHSMRSKYTFRCRAMYDFAYRFLDMGIWCDPFFGESPFKVEYVNDIRKSGIDSHDWIKEIPSNSCDGVIWDPPYSMEQCSRTYKSSKIFDWQTRYKNKSGEFPKIKNEISRICKTNSQVISFGWNSAGMGSARGFKKTHIKLVCHGGAARDTICVREVKD